jgi:hypothetical protein
LCFPRQTWGEEKGQIEDKVKTEKIDAGEESAESLAQKVKEEMKKIKVESDREEEEEKMELGIKKIGRQKEFRRKKEDEESSSGSGSDSSSSNSEVSTVVT